ncbi:hypothetical protein [Pantoea sp. Fr+CA_20]|uniref:hypothetical protein n=1 Tax=Pantoea TaxID=53335 RepID=UPI00211896CD|nr:hypothetical protein [Pantoea sp. Fr+CA_20]
MAGDYDGQLLHDVSMLSEEQPTSAITILKRISTYLSQLDKSKLDSNLVEYVEKIFVLARN